MSKHHMRTRRQHAEQPQSKRRVFRLEDLVARVPEQLRKIDELKARVAPELWARAHAPGAWKYAGVTPKPARPTVVLTLEELQARAQRVAELQARVDPAWLPDAVRFSAKRP